MEDIEERIVVEQRADAGRHPRALQGAGRRDLRPGQPRRASSAPSSRATGRRQVKGLYLAGGAAHPGPGMPMVMMSGWIAADCAGPRPRRPRAWRPEAEAAAAAARTSPPAAGHGGAMNAAAGREVGQAGPVALFSPAALRLLPLHLRAASRAKHMRAVRARRTGARRRPDDAGRAAGGLRQPPVLVGRRRLHAALDRAASRPRACSSRWRRRRWRATASCAASASSGWRAGSAARRRRPSCARPRRCWPSPAACSG